MWKNAQKNDKKNNTSDTIDKIIPHRNSSVTIFVCNPWYVPSQVTSRHHWIIVTIVITAPIPNKLSSYWWNHLICPVKVTIAPITPVSGHGPLFTVWNGWFSCIDINLFNVDKKNQIDVTFCILYFSSNSCSTCFGQPCAHHQELTTA